MSALDTVTGSFGDYTNADGTPNYGDVGVILNPDGTLSGGSGTGAVTGTGGNAAIGGMSGLTGLLKNLVSGNATAGQYAGLATLLYGLAGGNKPSTSPGWHGQINPNKYTVTRNRTARPAYVPYSGGSNPVMGRKHFADTTYTTKAATGGIMGLAHGGDAKHPRYLQGATDGMADELSTNIDGEQPAALSHGEFVIPADVVSHLGNGNSEAGAKQLYKMMDRIREARTGTKKQGKRINPDKFTPGGIAGYAGGGIVSFATGNLVTAGQGTSGSNPVTSESNLSSWAAPGVVNYIEKGTALADQPYQAYEGPLTAGASPLQQQAFSTASNLAVPSSVGKAANMIGTAGAGLGSLSYNATPVSGTYTATDPYKASNIGIADFNADSMQRYMNPYLQLSLNPQIEEARRQSQITQMGNAAKLAQAGAYGGSRGALMDTETQRNLSQNLANITGAGYKNAYDTALAAFNAQQGLGLQAQQSNEASRQFGAGQAMTAAQQKAQYDQAAQALNAQQQQFGANFGLSGLQGLLNAGTALGSLGAQENQMGLANLNALSGLGGAQRDIEQQGIDALYKQYEQERLDPYKQIAFQQSLYQGLPVSTVTGSTATTGLQDLQGLLSSALGIGNTVSGIPGG